MKNEKKKHGCLYAFLIGCVVFIVAIISLVVIVKDAISLFGVSVKQFQEYMKILNRAVDENVLATDPITNQDFSTFVQKANQAEFKIFDDKGNVNLNQATISIGQNMLLSSYEVGAMLNSGFANSSEYKTVKILQFSISQGTYATIKTVLKFDLTGLKNAVGEFASDLPNTIYLTCISTATASIGNNFTSRIILTDTTVKINDLSEEENANIIKLLKAMTSETDGMFNFENLSDKIVADELSKLALASSCYLVIENGQLLFSKM